MGRQRPRIDDTVLAEKNKVEILAVLDIKTYCKGTVIKTV